MSPRPLRQSHRVCPTDCAFAVLLCCFGCSAQADETDETEDISDDAGRTESAPNMCAWAVDMLLAQVEVVAPDRTDYGFIEAPSFDGARERLDCFRAELAGGSPAELRINRCTDCIDGSVFVGTAEGEIYSVNRRVDSEAPSPARTTVSVDRCESVAIAESGVEGLSCTGGEPLLACSGSPHG